MLFTASVISGAGRGRTIGSPTINLNLDDIPADMHDGIYAAWVFWDGHKHPAALFYGPRPVFDDTRACEAYLIDCTPESVPAVLTVDIRTYLRSVRNFATIDALRSQIAIDVQDARAMLSSDDATHTQNSDS